MRYHHFRLSALLTSSVALCFFAQDAHGQFVNDPSLWQNQFNQVSAQISSARNYKLLQPINRPPGQTLTQEPLAPSEAAAVLPRKSPFQPLQPIVAENSRPSGTDAGKEKLRPKSPFQPLQPALTSKPVRGSAATANETRPANPELQISSGILIPMAKAPAKTPAVKTALPTAPTNVSPVSNASFSAPTRTASARSNDFGGKNSAKAYSIEVTPHSFESGDLDKYEFRIYNPAPHSLRRASVKLIAPAGSQVAQVVPKPKSVAGQEIVFEIEGLSSNGQQIVEVLIKNPRNELAQFDSSVTSQDWNRSQFVVGLADQADAAEQVEPSKQVKTAEQANRQPIAAAKEPIINRELRLEPIEGIQLLEPIKFASDVDAETTEAEAEYEYEVVEGAIETARRAPESAATPMDDVLQAEYEKASKERMERESFEAFALTPETALETKRLGQVASLISGPIDVTVGQEVEFAVSLKNETTQASDPLVVQLSVPKDFQVTLLDRTTWYDAEGGKISWKVPSIGSQQVETIRYRAVARAAGLVKQGIVVGMGNELQGFCTYRTKVR